MIYVTSDIHGTFSLFYKLLIKINFSAGDRLYILGDALDKGREEENLCLLSFIKEQNNIFLLKGNHEYLCERYLAGVISSELWDACGGALTRREVDRLTSTERCRLLDYLRRLPLYANIEIRGARYFLTHSGYDADCCVTNPETGLIDIENSVRKAAETDQEKYLFSDDIHLIPASLCFDRKIIVGHCPTLLLPDFGEPRIFYSRNYIDIDTGNDRREAGGRLACLCLESGVEFYV